ncbi:MAG TPA: PAS domain S-box protein [Negativicutes bacterium]|nr:PAS domain S-box protein [Negativicutes bacterium]
MQGIENGYRQIFQGSPAVMLIIDPAAGNILGANQAAVDYYGYTLEELQSMAICKINIAPIAEIKECMAKVSRDYCKAIAFRHKLKDGSIRDVEVYSGPVRLGGRVLLHSIIIDVTAQKRAEADLRKSNEQLSLVVQGAKAGIWDWDMQTQRVFHDKQWKAILGYGEDELSGDIDLWTSRWHPEDADRIKRAMEDYLAGKSEKYEVEYRLRHRDGAYRWILTYGKISRDQAGRPIRWTGINIDITNNKRTEELYQESEKRLRDFAEAVPDTSFIIAEDGCYLEVFGDEKMFHIPKKEFLGKTTHQVLPEDAADFILNEVQQAIASGTQRKGVREMRFGAEKRYFSGRTVPLSYMVDGKRTAAVIAADITAQRRTEKMLQMTYDLRRRSDIMSDILEGKVDNDESFAYTSSRLGIDINLPMFVCKILSDKFDFDDENPQIAKINGVQKLKDGVMIALSEIPDCIAWDCRDGICVLCHAACGNNARERSKETAALIRSKLLAYDAGMQVFMGVSDVHMGIEGLKKSCRQALNAALAARSRAADEVEILHYREAGLFQFIPHPLRGNAAREYIEQHIGKLLEYDQAKQTNYLETLEDLLRGVSVRETAKKHHLHPKSVVFRHKSIARMLNIDLNDYQTRLALGLALQLYKLNPGNL